MKVRTLGRVVWAITIELCALAALLFVLKMKTNRPALDTLPSAAQLAPIATTK